MAFGPCGFESRRPYQGRRARRPGHMADERGGRDRRRGLSGAAQGARHRLAVRQCRHRLRADHRGALRAAPAPGSRMPEPLAVPHETVAVGMAHGYYLATGRPQAVMVHVNVGMANALMGLLNAARDNVPILFTSGRTPITEAGRHRGARPADPLGPGDARPGRHAARVRQVGLRAALRRAARADRRPRARDRHDPARAGRSI